MKKYPLTTKFIETTDLPKGNYLRTIPEGDRILPAFEYFLSLHRIEGFKSKLKEIKNNPIIDYEKNTGLVQWASICAEVGAIRLLGKELNIELTGFNQHSPKADSVGSECDIRGKWNNHVLYFEVKRNCKEDTQTLPDKLQSTLDNFDGPYVLAAQLLNRKYDSSNIGQLLIDIKAHIREFEETIKKYNLRTPKTPWPFSNKDIQIHFLDPNKASSGWHYLDPVSVNDICSFLLSPDRLGKDGKPMVPKVKQAAIQGADYLVCKIPDWSDYSFSIIVNKCFENVIYENDDEYIVRDSRFENLAGIILFNRYDKFSIINNYDNKKENQISVKA